MIAVIKKHQKGIAIALLALVLISAAYNFLLGTQVSYQLDSPLIPTQMKEANVRPFFVRGAILGLFGMCGFILFFYRRYYLLMVIATLALLGNELI